MVIADQPPLLFVHIPKTAGTSVIELFAPEGRRNHPLCLVGGKHETLAEFHRRHGPAVLARFCAFCIVRDPLTRFISHYRWLSGRPGRRTGMHNVQSLEDFVRTFDDPAIRAAHPARYLRQSDFVVIDGRLAVDRVIKFERLPGDLLAFLAVHGLRRHSMPARNRSVCAVPPVSPVVRDFVVRYYRDDYERFDYVRC